jgi:short subunit dehydrogenase-like uncharacterized protein
LAGRSSDRLLSLSADYPRLSVLSAGVEDAPALLTGVDLVINCAGPFADTALPLAAAAVRAGVHYLDLSAEQQPVLDLAAEFHGVSMASTVMPAAGFFGALGDLLATAAAGDWDQMDGLDEISVFAALDHWHPTSGTRRTGERNTGPRFKVAGGRLVPITPAHSHGGRPASWTFPAPFGNCELGELGLAETICISRHLPANRISSYLNLSALTELRDPLTPPPAAADTAGRSAQLFVMEAVAVRSGVRRAARVQGQDIYASSAPIVVEAAARIIAGQAPAGVHSPASAFPAEEFLAALPFEQLSLDTEAALP